MFESFSTLCITVDFVFLEFYISYLLVSGFEGIGSLLDSEFFDMTNFFSEYPSASKVKMFSMKPESKIPSNFCPEQPGTINGQQTMDRKVSFYLFSKYGSTLNKGRAFRLYLKLIVIWGSLETEVLLIFHLFVNE